MPLASPQPAFVIGVTGNLDPIGYEPGSPAAGVPEHPAILHLRQRIRNVLDWARKEGYTLDPRTGDLTVSKDPQDPWRSLGLGDVPIVMLSSLAPGVDTIVAEEVLDHAKQHPSVSLRAPLPFPADLFRLSSSFHTGNTPDPLKQQRFDRLVHELTQQPGYQEERDLFSVLLADDTVHDPTDLDATFRADLTALDPATGKPRRYLRYRAAGEYMAAYTDLLLSIHAEDTHQAHPDDRFDAGSVTIEEVKRRGLTFELLLAVNNVMWADNGPVLRIPIDRRKTGPSSGVRPWRILHPHDLPNDGRTGNAQLRHMVSLLKDFTKEDASVREATELNHILGVPRDADRDTVYPQSKGFLERLDALVRIRRRAADRVSVLETERRSLMRALLLSVLVAAVCLGLAEHWHPQVGHGEAHGAEHFNVCGYLRHAGLRIGLILGVFGCIVLSAVLLYKQLGSRKEVFRQDYRGAAEGMRVQAFWNMAGTGFSAPANYMQRQRNELDWIRHAISSISSPYTQWTIGFDALAHADRSALLQRVRDGWVNEQAGYFKKNATHLDLSLHFNERMGWGFTSAGILHLVLLFLCIGCPWLLGSIVDHHLLVAGVLILIGLFMLCPELRHHVFRKAGASRYYHPADHEDGARPSRLLRWLFCKPLIWGRALGLLGLSLWVIPDLSAPSWMPAPIDLWIVFTTVCLVAGALFLAWSERNFQAELSRQYRTMHELFASGVRRLDQLIARYRAAATVAEQQELKREIDDLLYQLGREALSENAEWLVLRRARPLEPFMAG